MIQVDNFTITEFTRLTGYENNKLVVLLDDLEDFSLNQEEERAEQQTRRGIEVIKSNKAVTGSGVNGILTSGMLETLIGDSFVNNIYTVRYADTIIVKDNKVCLTENPVNGIINGININFNSRGSVSLLIEQVDNFTTLLPNEFVYCSSNNTIVFAEDKFEDGTSLTIYYDIFTEGTRITNKLYKYSKTLDLYIDAICQYGNDEIYLSQFHIAEADFNGNFEISGETNTMKQYFQFTSLPNSTLCGNDVKYWDFTIYKKLS